jgi:hypothetical protein
LIHLRRDQLFSAEMWGFNLNHNRFLCYERVSDLPILYLSQNIDVLKLFRLFRCLSIRVLKIQHLEQDHSYSLRSSLASMDYCTGCNHHHVQAISLETVMSLRGKHKIPIFYKFNGCQSQRAIVALILTLVLIVKFSLVVRSSSSTSDTSIAAWFLLSISVNA